MQKTKFNVWKDKESPTNHSKEKRRTKSVENKGPRFFIVHRTEFENNSKTININEKGRDNDIQTQNNNINIIKDHPKLNKNIIFKTEGKNIFYIFINSYKHSYDRKEIFI